MDMPSHQTMSYINQWSMLEYRIIAGTGTALLAYFGWRVTKAIETIALMSKIIVANINYSGSRVEEKK